MKLRVFAVLALALALGAIGAWIWFGSESAESVEAANEIENLTAGAIPEPAAALPPAVAKPVETVSPPPPPLSLPAPVASAVVPGMPLVRTDPAAPRLIGGAPEVVRPAGPAEPRVEGKLELDQVRTMLRDFRTRIGENPVGSNAEIMKAVMGGNEVRARLGPPEGQTLNQQGELVDRWGNPYFFHQISKDSMEVRSAGPDGRMWTSDDLVTK